MENSLFYAQKMTFIISGHVSVSRFIIKNNKIIKMSNNVTRFTKFYRKVIQITP